MFYTRKDESSREHLLSSLTSSFVKIILMASSMGVHCPFLLLKSGTVGRKPHALCVCTYWILPIHLVLQHMSNLLSIYLFLITKCSGYVQYFAMSNFVAMYIPSMFLNGHTCESSYRELSFDSLTDEKCYVFKIMVLICTSLFIVRWGILVSSAIYIPSLMTAF